MYHKKKKNSRRIIRKNQLINLTVERHGKTKNILPAETTQIMSHTIN